MHNYWLNKYNINAEYELLEIEEKEIENVINKIKDKEIMGINVTLPYKKSVIPFLSKTINDANETHSVNTIMLDENHSLIGENTDVFGFQAAYLKSISNQEKKNKKVLILGAGGVAPSIILAFLKSNILNISITNRTYEKALNLKKAYPYLNILKWGKSTNFDIIINATSLGLKKSDEIKLNFENSVSTKLFYDVIYNPSNTRFLSKAKDTGNRAENGKTMFIYQAQLAFEIWHKIKPIIDEKVFKILGDD